MKKLLSILIILFCLLINNFVYAVNIDDLKKSVTEVGSYQLIDEADENKLRSEHFLKLKNKVIILDRGLHDYLGFSHHLLGEQIYFPKEELNKRYAMVFSLQTNGFIKNNIRIEKNQKEAEKIYEFVIQEYIKTGHKIIKVPNLAVDPFENAALRKEYVEKKINEYVFN